MCKKTVTAKLCSNSTTSAMATVRLLIADDHDLFLDGIISLLKTEQEFQLETAHDGYEVLDKVKKHEYDICMLDIGMPKLDGISTARKLRELKPGIRIIILTTYNDKEIISEMMKIGVSGYLLKNSTRQELVDAIRKIYHGGRHFSNEVQNTIVNQFTTYLTNGKGKNDAVLTPREIEIVQLLAKEFTNEKIAEALHISYRTVETHRKNIMQKTKAHNLAGLLKFAYDQGFIS